MIPSSNVPTIVGSAGGYANYRLVVEDETAIVEEFALREDMSIDWTGSPKSRTYFGTPAEAWEHVGRQLGWLGDDEQVVTVTPSLCRQGSDPSPAEIAERKKQVLAGRSKKGSPCT